MGNGSLSWTKRPLAAVEIEMGSTAALASGNESGIAATRISRQVVYSWNPALVSLRVRRLSQCLGTVSRIHHCLASPG